MKILSIILTLLICINCGTNKDIENHKKLAIQYRDEKDLGKAIVELRTIVINFPENENAAEAQFQIGEIYLNDVKDYFFAIDEFQKVIELFPDQEVTPKAAFMIGYIYSNYLEAFSYALQNYRDFLVKYPNHELIPSVEYEIDGLKEYEAVIDSLNKVAFNKKDVS